MARLLLIEGIPGSGKSTLAACLSTRLNKEVPPCPRLQPAFPPG